MIPYGKHFIDQQDILAVVKALKEDKITQGSIIKKFEEEIQKFLKVKYAVAVSSASAGLHIAVKSLPKLTKKDTAITSPISFVSTANSILHNSIKLKFSDIDKNTLNLEINDLIKNIKKFSPKLIIPVHLAGVSSNEKELKKLSKKNKFYIIEDAAHSFGGRYNDGSLIGSKYIYDCYAMRQETVPVHASAINGRGKWIPVVWPMDGRQADKGSGKSLTDQYKRESVNMLRDHFSNPPSNGMKEGSGGNSVEAGIMEILTRMQTKRLKIFRNQSKLLEELRMYHRKDGKIVPAHDDVISAMRYCVMSLRKARIKNYQPMQFQTDSEFNVFN